MYINKENYETIKKELDTKGVQLVAVSKTKPVEAILELYHLGQRDFGENYVQEMVEKQSRLPHDIRWHFIGHLQTNKVKYIAPFVHLIHGVENIKLIKEIDKHAQKNSRSIEVLLQVYIAEEETKFGLEEEELSEIMSEFESLKLKHTNIAGLMGMASFTENSAQVQQEFRYLKLLFDEYSQLKILSMGMSADYKLALEEGTTMVRIGSLLFGNR